MAEVNDFQRLNSAEEIFVSDFAVILDTPLVCRVCFLFSTSELYFIFRSYNFTITLFLTLQYSFTNYPH